MHWRTRRKCWCYACIDLPGTNDDAMHALTYPVQVLMLWLSSIMLICWYLFDECICSIFWTWKWRHNNCIAFLWSCELQASSSLKFDNNRDVMFYIVFWVYHDFNHNVFLRHYDSRHDKLIKQYEYNWIGKHRHIQAKSFFMFTM